MIGRRALAGLAAVPAVPGAVSAVPGAVPALLGAVPALLGAVPAGAQTAQPADYRWKVLRNGSEIGTHTITFRRDGDTLVALSEVLVTPRVLGVVVYRFEHRYTEITRGSRFVSVRSRLNRNGTIVDVEAEAVAGAVAIRGPEGALRLPADAAPLSWWQPQRFGGAVPIFGTTTGKLMDLRWTRTALPAGGTRWQCVGEVDATLDYDAQGRWVGYSVLGDDGSTVRYGAG